MNTLHFCLVTYVLVSCLGSTLLSSSSNKYRYIGIKMLNQSICTFSEKLLLQAAGFINLWALKTTPYEELLASIPW